MQKITETVNLLKRYLSDDLDELQRKELQRLLLEYPDLVDIIYNLENEDYLQGQLKNYEKLYSLEFEERQVQVLQAVLSSIRGVREPNKNYFSRKKAAIYFSMAAAVTMLFFGAVWWRIYLPNSETTEQMLSSFEPGGNKATLTLSNGHTLELTTTQSGITVGETLTYDDGTALFHDVELLEKSVLTLSTPRGGQYQVTLPDGTKVILNAESELRYPYRFSLTRREVELEGEAYFEVAPQEGRPFVVKTGSEHVEVLGTHFNVAAYREDIYSSVSLVEGKVKVSVDGRTEVLVPGLQSVVSDGKMSIQRFDVEETLAWKNGEFMFNNENITSVMRKLSRWYDVEIEVDPKLNELGVWGSLSRNDDFGTVLHLIKMTDDRIRVEVKGRSVKLMR